jgi:acetyl-CoA carboxylase biotin carboxyl carrier protein
VTDDPSGQQPDGSRSDEVQAVASLTDEVLPALIARLRASRLGELEIRSAGWRVRLRREPESGRSGVSAGTATPATDPASGSDQELAVARSPAVGYFSPGRDVAIGRSIRAGDSLGVVDMLGIVQDVPAPIDGVISRILAEPGQAVEYGQPLANVDTLGAIGSTTEAAD